VTSMVICESFSISYEIKFLISQSWISSPFYFVLVCATARSRVSVSLVESSVDFLLGRSGLPPALLCNLFL
jgi:hypothetical protein